MKTSCMGIESAIDCIEHLVRTGGPENRDYVELGSAIAKIHSAEFEIQGGLARRV